MKRSFKNAILIFCLLISFLFVIVEENHNCEGDGCLICLLSTIVNYVSKIVLIVNFVPLVFEKLVLFLNLFYSFIHKKGFKKQNKNNYSINPINNNEVNLNDFCIALK